jgi:hypothetical protein
MKAALAKTPFAARFDWSRTVSCCNSVAFRFWLSACLPSLASISPKTIAAIKSPMVATAAPTAAIFSQERACVGWGGGAGGPLSPAVEAPLPSFIVSTIHMPLLPVGAT